MVQQVKDVQAELQMLINMIHQQLEALNRAKIVSLSSRNDLGNFDISTLLDKTKLRRKVLLGLYEKGQTTYQSVRLHTHGLVTRMISTNSKIIDTSLISSTPNSTTPISQKPSRRENPHRTWRSWPDRQKPPHVKTAAKATQ